MSVSGARQVGPTIAPAARPARPAPARFRGFAYIDDCGPARCDSLVADLGPAWLTIRFRVVRAGVPGDRYGVIKRAELAGWAWLPGSRRLPYGA